MLRLIQRLLPAPAHRLGLRLAHRTRVIWWLWRKPSLAGVRVIALDAEGRVLLVRHTYGSGKWMPAGGGLRRGEDPVLAALRELAEEVGCGLEEPWLLDIREEPLAGTINRVHLVAGLIVGTVFPDGREVAEARLFAADELPADLPASFATHLSGWITAAKAGSLRR